ncbi:PhzF family phenazine biosynthesis isomerase [Actinacidiphila sp. ITFR-21]|uniref:PhzF family phenazine biosynthesis isomerase n=1 Tax=Actinacidiphila sp. ITFR-21 TaxID=3075199 RepID=UPI0028893038|nr:PhzF family phenazine biosynthesis isomerase [Streptomyces sp. ITFR-21]WNI18461.1 PhzF family phenazine biosynthesis isomerase [Streptomyces sp. ITFR-21]
MSNENAQPPVRQMRVVVATEDYERAVAFYGRALGLPIRDGFQGAGDVRAVVFDAGAATLEIGDRARTALADDVGAGLPAGPRIRLAFEVTDAAGTTDRLVEAGARPVSPPAAPPRNSLDSGLDAPGEVRIALFQEPREPAGAPRYAPFALVDVFGEESLAGNPLAVVDLTGDPDAVDDEWLRKVAREMNQSETTFVFPGTDGAVRTLRSFTAGGVEVTGAGHNALGAWWWLLHTGRVAAPGDGALVQRIGGRNLSVLVGEKGVLAMRQTPARLGATVDAPAALADAVGLAPGDLRADRPPRVVDTGAAHLMVLLTGAEALARAAANKNLLVAAADAVGAQGVYLAWLDDAAAGRTARTRFFNPGVGLDEDPATGSAAGPLGAYLTTTGDLAPGQALTVVQGEAMGRPSTLRVTVDAALVPDVSGSGSLTVEGRLTLPSRP